MTSLSLQPLWADHATLYRIPTIVFEDFATAETQHTVGLSAALRRNVIRADPGGALRNRSTCAIRGALATTMSVLSNAADVFPITVNLCWAPPFWAKIQVSLVRIHKDQVWEFDEHISHEKSDETSPFSDKFVGGIKHVQNNYLSSGSRGQSSYVLFLYVNGNTQFLPLPAGPPMVWHSHSKCEGFSTKVGYQFICDIRI